MFFKSIKRKSKGYVTLEELKRDYDKDGYSSGSCRYIICYLCKDAKIPISLCGSYEECIRELEFRENDCILTCGVDLATMETIMPIAATLKIRSISIHHINKITSAAPAHSPNV